MRLVNNTPISLLDGGAIAGGLGQQDVLVLPGDHELTRMGNPRDEGIAPWFVLTGTKIGAAESYLRHNGLLLD